MIQSLKNLFSVERSDPKVDSTSDVRNARLKVATCVILLEIARADDEFTPDERQSIVNTLRERFSLSTDEAHELIEFATEEREQSKDLWTFTNQINQSCDRDEKLQIIEEVWRVVIADGSIDGHERNLAHQLAKLLNITHGQLIELKMKVLEKARRGE